MTYIVTGAAGFIGANLVKALNVRGITRIIAVDDLTQGDRFTNLVDCQIDDYLDKDEFIAALEKGLFNNSVTALLHHGACSDTTESNGRYMMQNNYRYSRTLLEFCSAQKAPFIYASSAAIYGDHAEFRESPECENPLNIYGYSKFLFDQVLRQRMQEGLSAQAVGFRYFNVYGRNEAHKTRMASVAWHFFNQYRAEGKVRPFRGSGGYGREFINRGRQQWGRAMQADLADTVHWAVDQHLADPKRVCIVGGSYGGYAALMGPISDPGLYRCAASFAGVSDIKMLADLARSDMSREYLKYGMPMLVGEPDKEPEAFAAVSPLEFSPIPGAST